MLAIALINCFPLIAAALSTCCGNQQNRVDLIHIERDYQLAIHWIEFSFQNLKFKMYEKNYPADIIQIHI